MNDCKIICKNLPKIFFEDKNIAKNHFRRFGRIKKMIFKPKSRGCTIEYATKNSADKAIELGCLYENYIFEIVRETISPKMVRMKKDNDPDWKPDPEVEEELNAMGGGPSIGLKKYNLRPEVMDVSCIEEKPKKLMKRQWPIPELLKPPKKTKDSQLTQSVPLSDDQLKLIEIIRKPASGIDDKYKILDARDKLLRCLRRMGGNKTSATQGTCPDMCPEKERLQRVVQNQISVYEQDSNKEVNPILVVKQYSRSSADQEASLPHELRPVSVLQMTMSYLIHKIMNLGDNQDVNVGDWYHFLWDRTRGIRKDITQQELCCQGSVALVEQCARFHIHCSARLVAEDPSVFDQKINSEMLTKCLQTLKYMYDDLRLKGEACPNEAEFRAYIILLNLNDGNFMWEVQKLRPEIQKSHQVKTAIEVYSALDKNNFIRFFKLVHSATYLNACLLMRYFMQVRIRAITTIVKSFTPRINTTIYPLQKLTTNLAFESISHTIEFLQNCGLPLNSSKTGVILDRNMFTTPEYTYTCLDRSINVVESKRRDLSVGQVVCGGVLPPPTFENYVPQNSFDERGILNLDEHSKLAELLKVKKISNEERPLKAASSLPIMKVRNPYVFVKDSKDDELEHKPFKFDAKKPLKSSIFSLDNRNKNDNVAPLKKSLFSRSETKEINENVVEKPQNEPIIAPRNPFTKIAQSIFNAPLPDTQSVFVKKNENQTASIFNMNSEKSNSGNIFSQQQKLDNTTSIFSNKSQSIMSTNAEFSNQSSADETDFNKIKWDLNSPEKQTESKKEIVEIFFKPPTETITPIKTIVPNPASFKSFSFAPVVDQTDSVIPVVKAPEIDYEAIKEKQRKIQEEKQRLEQEHKEKLRKLEMERVLADQKRRENEDKQRRIREQEHKDKMEKLKSQEIKTAVSELIPEILNKVEKRIRDEKLTKLQKKIHDRMLLKVCREWRRYAIKLKKERKALECCPMWACSRSPAEEAAELRTVSQDLTLKYMQRYKLGKPLTLEYDERIRVDRIDFKEISDVIIRRYCELGMKFFRDIYWKGVISLPDAAEMPEGTGRIEEIFQQLFQWKDYNGETVLLDKYVINSVQSIKYCIEKQNAFEVKHYDANGFIFIAKNYNQVLCQRILENLKDFGIFVKVPIVIIFQEKPECSMNFDDLVKQGIISNYLILVDSFNPKRLTCNIRKGLKFLAQHVEKIPPLQLDTMKAFLIKNLCTEIWKKANSFCKWNSVYKNCLKNPTVVIELYNEALEKLKNIILNKSCYEFANFPTVFRELLPSGFPDYLPCDYKYFPTFCKKKSYFDHMSKILNSLTLKPLPSWPPKNETDLGKLLSSYISNQFKDFQKPFYRVLAAILKHAEHNSDFSSIANVVWTEVIEILALEKVNQIDFSFNDTEFFGKSIFNQTVVIYNPDSLNEYCNTDWFYVNNPVIKKHIANDSYSPRIDNRLAYDVTKEEMEKTISMVQNKLVDIDEKSEIRDGMKDFKRLLDDLEESLLINKKISSKFNERLVAVVEDE